MTELSFGRPSQASSKEPLLRSVGDAAGASYRAEGGSAGLFALRAATVAGVRHRLAGEGGQDAFAWAADSARVALAVADGLGSVEGSAEAAARVALAAVTATARGADDGVAMDVVLSDAVAAANAAASGGGATTLVVAVAGSDGRAVLAQVGDSTAFLVSEQGSCWRELFDLRGTDAESVVVATDCLPAEEPAVQRAEVRLLAGEVLVLATDGVADPWRDGPTTVAPALGAVACSRPSPLDLAAAADFSRQGCHDDRTVALLWLNSLDC